MKWFLNTETLKRIWKFFLYLTVKLDIWKVLQESLCIFSTNAEKYFLNRDDKCSINIPIYFDCQCMTNFYFTSCQQQAGCMKYDNQMVNFYLNVLWYIRCFCTFCRHKFFTCTHDHFYCHLTSLESSLSVFMTCYVYFILLKISSQIKGI